MRFASTTANGFIQIDSASPFLLFNRFVTDTNDPTTAAPGLVGQYENFLQVVDNSRNYLWSNDFVPRASFAHDRTHGYDFDEEVLVKENTRLLINIKNPAATPLAGTTYVILQGYNLEAVNA